MCLTVITGKHTDLWRLSVIQSYSSRGGWHILQVVFEVHASDRWFTDNTLHFCGSFLLVLLMYDIILLILAKVTSQRFDFISSNYDGYLF